MMWVLILAGFILLFIGGEALVRGSVGIARKFGLSELIIGLTLVGFGTSLPELVTSLEALSNGAVGLSIGNVIGSNVANIMLVIGAAAMVRTIHTHPEALRRDGLFLILVTAVFIMLIWQDAFTRLTGAAFVIVLLIYLIGSVILDRRSASPGGQMHAEEAAEIETNDPFWRSVVFTLIGMGGVVFGARFLVSGGSDAARLFGVSETVIGISIVAVGTSLPELVTSVMAARKGKADVALGNVLGSNVFNILGIIGVSALVYPFSLLVPAESAEPALLTALEIPRITSLVTWTDINALILSLALLVLFVYTGRRLSRWEGGVLLTGYALYIALSFGLIPLFAGSGGLNG